MDSLQTTIVRLILAAIKEKYQHSSAPQTHHSAETKKELPPLLREKLMKRGIISGSETQTKETDNEAPQALPTATQQPSVAEEPLPAGWSQTVDETYGRAYFYNVSTGESTWERPKSTPTASQVKVPVQPSVSAQAALSTSVVKASLPPGWKEVQDPNSQRVYYCNPHTGGSSWERPLDAAAVAKMKRCKGCGGFGRGLVKGHGFCLNCSRILKKLPPGVQSLDVVEVPAALIAGSNPKKSTATTVGEVSEGGEGKFNRSQRRALGMGTQGVQQVHKEKDKVPPLASISKGSGIYAGPGAQQATVQSGIGPNPRGSAHAANYSSQQRRQKTRRDISNSDAMDPMDPSSYSDAPRGKWSAGLSGAQPKCVDATASVSPVIHKLCNVVSLGALTRYFLGHRDRYFNRDLIRPHQLFCERTLKPQECQLHLVQRRLWAQTSPFRGMTKKGLARQTDVDLAGVRRDIYPIWTW